MSIVPGPIILGSMASSPETPRIRRIRRTAEDARAAILDAAEKRLVASGAAGIRLKEVADEVGVSHPTVLHHFGNRERLVDEVIARRVDAMNHDVLAVIAAGISGTDVVKGLFERLAHYFGALGHARVAAFLALDGRPSPIANGIRPLADALHASRVERAAREGWTEVPDYDDSYFVVLLVAFALFGEAIVARTFQADLPEDEVTAKSVRFRAWLADLVRGRFTKG